MTIGKRTLDALVADTFVKKMIGLMFRDGLPSGGCMLFAFDYSSRQGIWMRNMKFPIDIVWLDEKKRITGMKSGTKPANGFFDFTTYYPGSPSKYIIELPSGFLSRNKVGKNSKVSFKI
ncbi:MAG TPA: DUF192 domain-containing protein [Candidatus Acidoferrales bacterium]|nr:DUF192 domain-containing protein [Candidatus Acidoferrales bacterium]